MALDRFKLTLKGGMKRDKSDAETVVVWFSANIPVPESEGEAITYLGGERNDETVWRWTFKGRIIPFSYEKDGIIGHDFTKWLALVRKILAKRYRWIALVEGPDRIGGDGATQFWAELLAGGDIPVYVKNYSQRDPDDGRVWVEVEFGKRSIGL